MLFKQRLLKAPLFKDTLEAIDFFQLSINDLAKQKCSTYPKN